MIKVLIADDHALFRDGLKRIFNETDDIDVVAEAIDGKDILKKTREFDWDIALLDINLPDINGLDILKRILTTNASSCVLVLSMYPEEEYAIRAIRSGASGYLTKESDSEILVAAIRRVAAGGVYISQKVAELMVRGIRPIVETLPHDLLSDREYQVFNMLVKGTGLTEIGLELSLSVKTISTHKTHILQKMNLANTGELIRYAITHGLAEQSEY